MFVPVAILLSLYVGHIFGHTAKCDAKPDQMLLEKTLLDENHLTSDLHRSLAFDPPNVDFGLWSVGTIRSHVVTLVNNNVNRTLHLSSISGKTPSFFSSFFEDDVIPPQGNTTFSVIFLPRNYGKMETNLMIHTSFGQAKLVVRGEGKHCPYRLPTLIGIKAPLNATLNPEIRMYNPHPKSIQILEIYSSGGLFKLELPTGEYEGPQALWEIPPHTTKPIIRMHFHGSQPGNHSTYIRIRISEHEENNKESVHVIPVEFEISQHHGIYSSNPVIDIGTMLSSEDTKMIKLNLTNSGSEKVDILEYRFNNLPPGFDFKKSNFTLFINPKEAKDNYTLINGQLVIKSQTNETPKIKMYTTIAIRGEIFKGSLQFSKNTTIFITKPKNYTRAPRDFYIKNLFMVPIAISNISVNSNDTSIFNVTDFTPSVIGPGKKLLAFRISLVTEPASFITPLRLLTNLTTFELPVIVCSGLLKRYTSLDSVNLTKLPSDKILDYGIVQAGEQSPPGLILMVNPNPIPIQLLKWNFTNPRDVYYQSMFLGCLKPAYESNTTAAEKFKFCVNLPPYQMAAFQLVVESYTVRSFHGVFKIWSEFEEIHTKVKFISLLQRLEMDQSKLHFRDCFPGKQCSAEISIHSTFVKPMRINSFHVSVPGLVVEYQTESGWPEITPNGVTDVGFIHFDPKSVCLKKCYVSQDDSDVGKKGLYFDQTELNRRRNFFRKFKWALKQITFSLNTTQVRLFEFNTTVDLIWPKLVTGHQMFPSVEVGQSYKGVIFLKNPTSKPLQIELSLSDPKRASVLNPVDIPPELLEPCDSCLLTSEDVFLFDGQAEHIMKPDSTITVVVIFAPQTAGKYSTLLQIKNNLTLYEAAWITATATLPQFRFGNRKPGSSTPILFEISERHLTSCDDSSESKEYKIVTTKRTLTARNTGEWPIHVETFLIGDRYCEGYGFKIVDCSSFYLFANSSKKVDIIFTPDFTMTRVSRPLVIKTNLSYAVNYTLLATIPRPNVEKCASTSSRPDWEEPMKKCSVGMLSVAFIFVLVASFFDCDKILKDHLQNLSREKGPVQPPLDLRSIALKSTLSDDSVAYNSTSTEKISVKNSNGPLRKRNPKRTSLGAQILTNREKSWAEELAKKISSISKKDESSNTAQLPVNLQNGSPPKPEAGPVNGVRIKDDKCLNLKKSLPKEKEVEYISEKSHSEKIFNSDSEKKDTKIEPIPSVDVRKTKVSMKRNKIPPTSHTNIQNDVSRSLKFSPNSASTNFSNSPDRGSEKNHKQSKYQKDNSETTEKKCEQVEKKVEVKNESFEKKVEFIERKIVPLPTEPPKSPVHPIDTTVQGETFTPLKASSSTNKKYGKTPGRERKKEHMQSKRSDRRASKFKGNAFQFSAPLQNNANSNNSNVSMWNPNQASFSHVVAQKPEATDSMSSGTPTPTLENVEGSIVEHDWNEADLKNHETFGPDCDIKQSCVDLGPIGTKKSPSTTPIWEPLPPVALHRPTPNIPPLNSSFFSSNFPIASSSLDYSADNQYLGGASGLLEHLITENQNQRRWQSNEVLLSLMQTRESNPGWDLNNPAWTPMGYQSNNSSLLSDSLNVWQTRASLRPPPGLSASTIEDPNGLPQTPPEMQAPNQFQEDTIEPMTTFDPFSSLSSIWSETWTKKSNK